MVSVEDIKSLREETGAGVMECKKALAECEGDAKAAAALLKERGIMKAADKSERKAKEGLVGAYIHGGGRIGVLVEVNCETDFVARNEEFKSFLCEVAMQIAATDPAYVSEADVPEDEMSSLKGKEKDAYLKENCLLSQAYIRDESMTVGQLLTDLIAKTGENIIVRRFARFALGEEG